MARVRELHVYPLKSARGIALESARICATGFEWDRHWMAVDQHGKFLSQRTHPQLARVSTQLTATHLVLTVEHLPPCALPLEPTGASVPVRVWKDECEGLESSAAASDWLSAALGEAVRLVRTPRQISRRADPQYAGDSAVVSFADGFPVLVCNLASLEELNARMPEAIPMERFRPNIVLEGLPAFAEDDIAALRIGAVTLRLVKPCTRCVIPSTDQRTGLRGADPLPVLRTFRFDRTLLGVTFGENAVIATGIGTSIERGMDCEVEPD
jgi:uncharacterized protein